MGTHPIFESDFDCLTDGMERCYIIVIIISVLLLESILVLHFLNRPRLIVDSNGHYTEQLRAARQLVEKLEELEKIERLDPNDPQLGSLEHAMRINLAEQQLHQIAKDNVTIINEEYSQKKYYPNKISPNWVCRDQNGEIEHIYLLIVVKSITSSFARRKAVRSTWGNTETIPEIDKLKVRRLFLIGNSLDDNSFDPLKEQHEALLQAEANEYGDILQGEFHDSFRNLTLKEIMFLNWLPKHCPKTQFIFKGDDDIFANVPNIITYLHTLTKSQQRDLFVGSVLYPSPRIDEPRSKYYVSEKLWPEKYYPPYVSGGGFIMSYVMAIRIFEAMKELPIIPIDDAFIGVCLRKLGYRPTNHKGFKSWGVKYLELDNCVWSEVMTFHKLQPEEMEVMWRKFINRDKKQICANTERKTSPVL